jgi:hypothetical protein
MIFVVCLAVGNNRLKKYSLDELRYVKAQTGL